MELQTLGRTGVAVSKLALGTMALGRWGNADHGDAIRVIHAGLDRGVNLIDTADMYSAGESEEIVGKALVGRRDEVVLATKAFFPMGPDPNMRGSSRRWLTRAVEDSLRRLQTDYIDLFQLHRPDPSTDIDETLSVLSDLVRAGKLMAIGTSGFPPEHLVEARWCAEARGHVRFVSEQAPYSIFVRGIESGVLPVAQRYGLGVLTWSPLNSGWLTGRYRRDQPIPLNDFKRMIGHKFDLSLPGNLEKFSAIESLHGLAAELGVSLTHLALAFACEHPAVTSVIVGPRTVEQLNDLLESAELRLDSGTLDRIDEIVLPGVNLNQADVDYTPAALLEARLRRRAS